MRGDTCEKIITSICVRVCMRVCVRACVDTCDSANVSLSRVRVVIVVITANCTVCWCTYIQKQTKVSYVFFEIVSLFIHMRSHHEIIIVIHWYFGINNSYTW